MLSEEFVKNLDPDGLSLYVYKSFNSVYLNTTHLFAKLVGYQSAKEMIGLSDQEICYFDESHKEMYSSGDKKVVSTKQQCVWIEEINWVDHKRSSILTTKIPVHDHLNNITGVFATVVPLNNITLLELITFLRIRFPESAPIELISPDKKDKFNLTEKELQVLFYVLRGKSAKQIAACLGNSPRTIEIHLENIKEKFKCYSKSSLISCAIEHGYMTKIPKQMLVDSFLKPDVLK